MRRRRRGGIEHLQANDEKGWSIFSSSNNAMNAMQKKSNHFVYRVFHIWPLKQTVLRYIPQLFLWEVVVDW